MTQPIHDAAQRGYTQAPDSYQRGRPDYPQALVAWLDMPLGVRAAARVVDLGYERVGTDLLVLLLDGDLDPDDRLVVVVEELATDRRRGFLLSLLGTSRARHDDR